MLYSSGPYWDYKNRKIISQLKKYKIKNFRNSHSGVGTSYTDNLQLDIRNEINFKGRIVSLFFSLPLVKRIFQEQLNITSNLIDSYLKNLNVVYKNNDSVSYLLNKYKFENTTEFGCIKKFTKNNQEFSVHYLDMAQRVDILSKKFNFNKINSYFEIGGGFGANIHFLLTNFKNIKKIIYLDAVPNIYVGTEYLRHFYKENVKDYLYTKSLQEISFENNDKLEILCIPPWEIKKLNVKIKHFHNCASFVEMPKKVVENYVTHINKTNPDEISLISYDVYDLKTTFAPEELNNFFENKLEMEWEQTLIKDYERKLLYLTLKKN